MRAMLMSKLTGLLCLLALGASANVAAQSANDEIFAGGFETIFTLSISNYLDWCTISVDGATSATTIPDTSYREGTVVTLAGAPASATFVWGYWTGTDGDTTPSHDTSMTTSVTMSSDRSVLACCPINGGSQTCP